MMDMPNAVKTYFSADQGQNADLLTDIFSSDAIVHDEGENHTGTGAIRTWWLAAKAKYNHVAEPIEANTNGDRVTVRAKVSGTFPNSPVTLDYFFHVKDGKITEMGVE
ncbi:nuclear transport factor 2 family protein [Thalassospira sp. CH_XMU1448-2]